MIICWFVPVVPRTGVIPSDEISHVLLDAEVTMIRRTASVPTDRPARWAKQLLSHFSAKVDVVLEGEGGTVTFGAGKGTIRVEPNRLVFEAEGATEDDAQQVQNVLGGHFERFAAKEDLKVIWSEAD
jgi:uncharacterized protein